MRYVETSDSFYLYHLYRVGVGCLPSADDENDVYYQQNDACSEYERP